jgi:hypothetical protein
MSEVIITEWDGPVLEIEPSSTETTTDGESNHAIGPITRRRSTNTPPPEQNTCLCGDCLCCCKYLCPWCGLS